LAHGAVKYLLRVLEAVLLFAVLGVGVLAWRLSQGPVTISLIAPYVASALESFDPGYRITIEHAEFRWAGFKGQPLLTVRDVRVQDETGNVIAGLPSMSAYLSVPALARGDVAPEKIILSNPIIRFVHRKDGTFALGVQSVAGRDESERASGTALFASMIDALGEQASSANPSGYLNSVAIDGTTLMLIDEVTGRRWLAPNAELGFERDDAGVQLRANLLVSEDGKNWDASAVGHYLSETNRLSLDFSIENFSPSRVADLAPQLSVLSMVEISLSGGVSAELSLQQNGAVIEAIDFNVSGDSGRISNISEMAFEYPVKNISLKGNAGPSLNSIEVERFVAVLDCGDEHSPTIQMSAIGRDLNSQPSINVRATMDELPIEALKTYWPDGVKPNTSSWIAKNLSGGGLSETNVSLHLAGSSLEDVTATELRLTSQLHDVEVQYIQGMPWVEKAGGLLTMGLKEVVIDLDNGEIPDSLALEGLRVSGGRLRMHNLGEKGEELADFDIDVVGNFGAVMRLIDNEPFAYASAVGMDAAGADGNAVIKMALDFPLVKDLKLDQVDIQVEASIINAKVPEVAFNLPLTNGDVFVNLDRNGMDVSGGIELGDIPAKISWRENFIGGEFRSRYDIQATVNNENRPKVGLSVPPFTPPYIDGPVSADVVYTVDREANGTLVANIDLSEPVVSLPELSWRKEPGVAARSNVQATFVDGRLDSIDSFEVMSGEDLKASGNVVFSKDTKLKFLRLDSSIIGDSRIEANVEVDEAGKSFIEIGGPALNANSLLKELSLNNNGSNGENNHLKPNQSTPTSITASFDRVWMSPHSEFNNVEFSFDSEQDGVRAVEFRSEIDESIPFEVSLHSNEDERSFEGHSPNGGRVLRALGVFGDIEGGNLQISGDLSESGIVSGIAKMEDFKLVDAPIVARLLSVASLTGILDELRGEGISFDTLRVPFSYANSSLSIEDGGMFGSSLGLTGQGQYNFNTSMMNFDGTLIPAYTFNSALNSIPLLGDLFTAGDEDSGIFAATYSYRGNVETAQPTVNPLAAFAPGFLRHIFDIFKSNPQEAYAVPSPNDQESTPASDPDTRKNQ